MDRHDVKQYRELYGTPEAVKAVREGKPVPSGSVALRQGRHDRLHRHGEARRLEWEYARFTPDCKLNTGANDKARFQCHKPHEKQDFVKTGANDVNIAGFAFGPQKLSIGAGRSVT